MITRREFVQPKTYSSKTVTQVITFIAINTLLTTLILIWMFQGAQDNPVAVVLMMWTPGLSALLTSLLHRESIGWYGWRPKKPRVLAASYVLPALVAFIAYGLVWLSGYADFTPERVINYNWAKMLGFALPVPFVVGVLSKLLLASLLTAAVTLGEEIGWSGFLTPKLLSLTSVPATSFLVGGYWALWHYPAIIGGLYGTGTPLWVALPGFTLALVGASFFRTVLVGKSKSLWAGVLLHTGHNVVLMGMFYDMTVKEGIAGYLVSESGVVLGAIYLLAGLLYWRMTHKREAKG